jgi:hypothetical protein
VESGEAELLPLVLLLQGFRLGGGILPLRSCRRPGGTPSPPSLPSHPQLVIVGMVRFPPNRAHYELTRDPTGGHERNEKIKLHKLPKANARKLILVLSTPSLKGVGPAPGFKLAP